MKSNNINVNFHKKLQEVVFMRLNKLIFNKSIKLSDEQEKENQMLYNFLRLEALNLWFKLPEYNKEYSYFNLKRRNNSKFILDLMKKKKWVDVEYIPLFLKFPDVDLEYIEEYNIKKFVWFFYYVLLKNNLTENDIKYNNISISNLVNGKIEEYEKDKSSFLQKLYNEIANDEKMIEITKSIFDLKDFWAMPIMWNQTEYLYEKAIEKLRERKDNKIDKETWKEIEIEISSLEEIKEDIVNYIYEQFTSPDTIPVPLIKDLYILNFYIHQDLFINKKLDKNEMPFKNLEDLKISRKENSYLFEALNLKIIFELKKNTKIDKEYKDILNLDNIVRKLSEEINLEMFIYLIVMQDIENHRYNPYLLNKNINISSLSRIERRFYAKLLSEIYNRQSNERNFSETVLKYHWVLKTIFNNIHLWEFIENHSMVLKDTIWLFDYIHNNKTENEEYEFKPKLTYNQNLEIERKDIKTSEMSFMFYLSALSERTSFFFRNLFDTLYQADFYWYKYWFEEAVKYASNPENISKLEPRHLAQLILLIENLDKIAKKDRIIMNKHWNIFVKGDEDKIKKYLSLKENKIEDFNKILNSLKEVYFKWEEWKRLLDKYFKEIFDTKKEIKHLKNVLKMIFEVEYNTEEEKIENIKKIIENEVKNNEFISKDFLKELSEVSFDNILNIFELINDYIIEKTAEISSILISKELKNKYVYNSSRNASDNNEWNVVQKWEKFALTDDTKYLRFFMYWKDKEYHTNDMDLHATIFHDKENNNIQEIYYWNLNYKNILKHSWDVRSGQYWAAEFIDVDIIKLKEESPNWLLIFSMDSYLRWGFDSFEALHMWFLTGEDKNKFSSWNQLVDPKNVNKIFKINPRSQNNDYISAVYSVEDNAIYYLDLNLNISILDDYADISWYEFLYKIIDKFAISQNLFNYSEYDICKELYKVYKKDFDELNINLYFE